MTSICSLKILTSNIIILINVSKFRDIRLMVIDIFIILDYPATIKF